MKVFYAKDNHLTIYFPAKELKQALGVVKALAKYFNAGFLWRVARDLERDLQPQIPFNPRYRLCENCMCEIDLEKQSFVHVDNTYYHVRCPELKDNRPI